MTSEMNSRDRTRSILVFIATIAMIVFNGLAATGYVNGITPEVVSGRYETVMTPAGYAFSIWTLIYVGLFGLSIYQMLPSNIFRFRSVRSLYIVSCFLNCAWIFFWHREQIGICLGVIFALAAILLVLLKRFRRPGLEDGQVFTKAIFGLYGGWVTAAALVNFSVFMRYAGVDISSMGWNALAVALLLIAAALAVFVRLKLKNYLYSLAIAWAATAIAVKQSGNTAVVVAASICVIVCLVMAVSFVMDQKSTTS